MEKLQLIGKIYLSYVGTKNIKEMWSLMDSSPWQERILTNKYWFTFSFSLKKFSTIFDTRIWNLFGIVRAYFERASDAFPIII